MEFKKFVDVIKKRFDEMVKHEGGLLKADVDKHQLYDMYLDSFPEGTNSVYKERREYDCNVCKNFIRDAGSAIIVKDNKIETVWDVEAPGYYADVCRAMAAYVKSVGIRGLFKAEEQQIGKAQTHQEVDGDVITWNHFHGKVPVKYTRITDTDIGKARGTIQVFRRGLEELTDEAISIVLDLINSNSIYRGEENRAAVEGFAKLKREYDELSEDQKDGFLWTKYHVHGARVRGDMIGTLMIDISDGDPLDVAVAKYEEKAAPTNYKRPTALITQGMIKEAMKTIDQLGIRDSLTRRFAVASDLSVNNVLFVDRAVAPAMKDSLEDMLLGEVKSSKKDFSKVEEIGIEDFVQNVLPNVSSMEVIPENKHNGNFMSLIAPVHQDAPNILKWNNNFTWNYNGNITDSMKERVKAAGGDVTGVLRFSIQWNDGGNDSGNDLDAHCEGPSGHIYFSAKSDGCTGKLDVDIRHPGKKIAVENITWQNLSKMPNGTYRFLVHNYSGKNTDGFTAQIEFGGTIYSYTYPRSVSGRIPVAEVTLKNGQFTINHKLTESESSTDVWGVKTNEPQKVSMLTISPNHWDDQKIGNKHYFFVLEGCKTDVPPRGIYNEFLDSKFDKHRKVFEVLGAKTKCEMTDDQLSGLGFSTTKRDDLIVKVQGTFNRTYKIKF